MNFSDFYWHDSIVKNIFIDRSTPGYLDKICLDVNWADDSTPSRVVFEKVYQADLNLNFGVIASENILRAYEKDEDDVLRKLYQKWRGQLDDIRLRLFVIELNSTGGRIQIISTGFKIEGL